MRVLEHFNGGREEARSKASQRDFLPGALAVQDRPPSPAGRALLWLILALFAMVVVWASLGEVDIVVTAPGKVVPSGYVKVVQAPESGRLAALYVADGQAVEQGELLMSLDAGYAQADNARLSGQRASYKQEVSWRRLYEQWFAERALEPDNVDFSSLLNRLIDSVARSHLAHNLAQSQARLEGLDNELEATKAEQRTVQREMEKNRASLQVLTERVSAYKSLMERQYGARVQYLELLQQQTGLEKNLPILASRADQLAEKSLVIKTRSRAAESEMRSANLAQLANASMQLNAIEQDLVKARKRRESLQIVSPVSGTVQEIAVYTLGGVVNQAQVLMKVVPSGAAIEVEALLQNQDIGFIHKDQAAAVKIDTFNFTKYGLIDAKILNISDDAILDEQRGWVFKAKLQLEKSHLNVEGRRVSLSPGMSVTAEVKTGTRRLIEFFLSPLLRYKQESVRER